MNEQNLISIADRTTSEQREITRKGGIASGKKRRERKLIADVLRSILDEPIAKGSRQTKLAGISIKAVKKVFDNPDIRDVKILAELLGEMKAAPPVSTNNTILNINTSETGARNIRALTTDTE